MSIHRSLITCLLALWTSGQLVASWDLKPSAEKYWNLKKLGLLHQKEPILSIGHEFSLQQPDQSPGYHAYYYSHHPHQSFTRHQQLYPEIEGRSVSSSSSSKYSSSPSSPSINSNDKKADRNHFKSQASSPSSSSSSSSGCTYKGQRYYHSQSVVTNQPCLNCTCQRGFVSCYLRVCPTIKPPEGDDSCFLLKEEGNCCATLKCSSNAYSAHDTYHTITSSSTVSPYLAHNSTSKYVKSPVHPVHRGSSSSSSSSSSSTASSSTSTSTSTTTTPATPVDVMTPVASAYTSFTHKSTYNHASNVHERRAESPAYGSYNKLYPMKLKEHHHSTPHTPYKQETTYWSSHSPRPFVPSTVSPLRSSFRPYINQITSRPHRPWSSSGSYSSSTPSYSSSAIINSYSRRPVNNNSYKTSSSSSSSSNYTSTNRRPLYQATTSTTSSPFAVNSLRQSSSIYNRRPVSSTSAPSFSPLVASSSSSSSSFASSSTAPAVAAITKQKNKISNDFVASSASISSHNSSPVSSSSISSKNNAYKDSPNEAFSFFRLSSILV